MSAPRADFGPSDVVPTDALSSPGDKPFPGFAPPTSNATYCPNQFLDVVLPHFSRGVVRLVGYIVYRTFAWSDRDGRPVNEQHQVSYRELVNRAGISRGAIRQAVDEAVGANLVRVVRRGQAGRVGAAGEAHVLELNWHVGEYTRDATAFRGFFDGAGHRTYIPNQFFTHLLPNEPLSVLKVVGAVIRFSIGFEVRRGFRRQQAALSYSAIQRYSRIGSREDLSRSLKHALHCNYIQRVELGAFDPNAGRLSRAASYGLHWADSQPAPGQSKTRTGLSQEVRSSEPKAVPAKASNSRTGTESNSRTGGGPGTEPAHRSRIRTDLEMHLRNEHCKQQQAAAEVVRDREARLRCLREAGFDEATSVHLASHALELIQRQIHWMGARTVTRNKLGMLRKAIEQDWPEPNGNSRQFRSDLSPTTRFAKHYYAGLANNRSTPVAHPTEEDILASEPLLRALQTLSEGTSLELWGLRFGQYVARHCARELGPTGLARATRQHGDAFLVSEQRKSEQQRRKRDGEERGLTAELKEKYLHFLRSEEERLREQETRDYKAFLEVRNRQRKTLLRLAGGDGHSPLLKSFDSEVGRLSDLQAFFSSQVPTLQAWEATTAVER